MKDLAQGIAGLFGVGVAEDSLSLQSLETAVMQIISNFVPR